jgi:hypothetical protein
MKREAEETSVSNNRVSQQILEEAVAHSAYDPAFFLRFFLSKWFPTPLAPFQLGLVALVTRKVQFLNDYPAAHDFLLNEFFYAADPSDPTSTKLPVFQLNEEGKLIMIAGDNNNFIIPRGYSKTTLLNGLNLYDCTTDGTVFGVYISATATHAETQLGNIRFELEGNELLRAAYGNVVPTKSDAEKWSSDQLQLRNGAILVARGRGGQVRGLNFQARRPNKILLDDVEDEDSIATGVLRVKTERWFYAAVSPAGNEMDGAQAAGVAQQPLMITNLGTLLGPECLMMTLAKDPQYNTVKFGAKLNLEDVDDEKMLWPYKMSHERYLKQRARYQKLGKLAEFTRENDSSIRVSDDTIFPAVFIYQPTLRSDLVHVSQALDPAISEQPGRDHAAIVVAGRRASDGALWFLDEWGGLGKTPREKVDEFFNMQLKWNTTHNGIEAQQYQASLIFLMREEMARRQYFFSITPIVQGSKVRKEDRIVGTLSPRYMNGYIRHLRHLPNLEGNLADWPNGKKDYADAASMALSLLGESAGLVVPDEERGKGEYAPLEPVLPSLYESSTGFITRRVGFDAVRSGRYG